MEDIMQAVFEKIIEKLEILQKDKYVKSPIMCHALEKSIEIVKQAAAEYNNGWIPCSERLPTEREFEEYVVTIYGATKATTLYYAGNGEWYDENGECYRVIAWMPLPDSFKPKGE